MHHLGLSQWHSVGDETLSGQAHAATPSNQAVAPRLPACHHTMPTHITTHSSLLAVLFSACMTHVRRPLGSMYVFSGLNS